MKTTLSMTDHETMRIEYEWSSFATFGHFGNKPYIFPADYVVG